MEPPASLPAQMYLLTYDVGRQRMARYSYLGYLLRAAALTDLFLDGRLTDAGGKAHPADPPNRGGVDDPVLSGVLEQIVTSRPRSWKHWVGTGKRSTIRAVRDQLENSHVIQIERRRLLGVFPADRVTVRNTQVVRQLARRADQALQGTTPLTRLEPRAAALAALAAAGELGTVTSRRQRRQHKQRISGLSVIAGPAIPALRAAKVAAESAAAVVPGF